MRRWLLPPCVFACAFFACGLGAVRSEAKPPPRTFECGNTTTATQLAEPPDVVVSSLPLNAQHEHELIVTVHRDGERFCYRYQLNGVSYSVPPTIRVHRGERFAFRLVNAMHGKTGGQDVSSSAIMPCMPMAMPTPQKMMQAGYFNHPVVDLVARMPWYDTNIHFHGFQGPAVQEDIFVSTLSTPMHACEYHLAIPMTQPPGTYFYHPHAHGASGDQVFGGLSGAWIVEPDVAQIDRRDEHTLIIRDIVPERDDNLFAPDIIPFAIASIKHNLSKKPAHAVSYDPFHPAAWPSFFALAPNGRGMDPDPCVGVFAAPNVSVNGAKTPATLDVAAGTAQLLRIVNGTSDSIKLFRLRDAAGLMQQLRVVGRDGVPVSGDASHPLLKYVAMNSILLPPAGRVDVLVAAQPGRDLTLYSDHVCLGPLEEATLKHDIVTIHPVQSENARNDVVVSTPLERAQSPAEKLLSYARAHPELVHRRALTYTQYAFPPSKKIPPHASFYITETTNPRFAEMSYWPQYRSGDTAPRRADIVVKQGSIEEWTLFNATPETHTFHIHQMAFVAEDDASGAPAMLDTVVVPFGKQIANKTDPDYPLLQPGTTRILLDFRHVPRGTFVFHCHMLFHEDRGMMGVVRVI
jgi:FtsP/CotA-like multicopper oxidase with cupredoxin domain